MRGSGCRGGFASCSSSPGSTALWVPAPWRGGAPLLEGEPTVRADPGLLTDALGIGRIGKSTRAEGPLVLRFFCSLWICISLRLFPDSSYFMLPWWLSGKEPTCQCRRCGFNPGVGKIPWGRKWQATPVFLPGEPHGQRSLGATVHGVAKSPTWLSN